MIQSITLNDGRNIQLRKISVDDIHEFFDFTKYIYYHLNEFNTDTAEEFSNSIARELQFIQKFDKPFNLLLGAFCAQQLIGNLDFTSNRRQRLQHIGEFGISLHEDFQNCGIGQHLLRMLIDWAKANGQTKMIRLSVHANNARAIHLYQKMGFVQYGYLKNCILQLDGTYTDSIDMVLEL